MLTEYQFSQTVYLLATVDAFCDQSHLLKCFHFSERETRQDSVADIYLLEKLAVKVTD